MISRIIEVIYGLQRETTFRDVADPMLVLYRNNYKSSGSSNDWVFLKFQCKPSCMLRMKSVVESSRHAVGTGQGAKLQTSASPTDSSFLSLPSNDAHAFPLLFGGTSTRSVTLSGNIRGLNDKECGQIGVKRMPGTCITI